MTRTPILRGTTTVLGRFALVLLTSGTAAAATDGTDEGTGNAFLVFVIAIVAVLSIGVGLAWLGRRRGERRPPA